MLDKRRSNIFKEIDKLLKDNCIEHICTLNSYDDYSDEEVEFHYNPEEEKLTVRGISSI